MGLIEKVKGCFDEAPINTGRQVEMDLARAIPVFCLPFVHTVIECTPVERIYDPIPFFFNIVIGQPLGAPMFLFAMGACISYSRRNSPQNQMLRGATLFVAGFLLNVLRFFIPYMTGYLLTGEADKYLTPLPYRVFGNDVLQFAGLFFLLIGFLCYLKVPDKGIVLIAAIMSVCGSLIRHFDTGNVVLNIALGHFMGTEDTAGLYVMSDFPLLNWFIVPVCGYVFGKALLHLKDKDTFYKIVTPVPFVLYIAFCVIEYVLEFGQMGTGDTLLYCENCYYHALWYDTLGFAIFAVSMLGVYHFIMKVLSGLPRKFIISLSRNITHVYVVHWFLVVMLTNVVLYVIRGTQDLPIGPTLLLSLVIFLITYPSALFWEKQSKKNKEKAGA